MSTCSDVESPLPGYGSTAKPPGSTIPPNTVYSQPHFTSGDFAEENPRPVLKPGLYVPTLTFFKKDTEALDEETIADHAVRMAKAGVAGLLTQGTNGEAAHLLHLERTVVTKTTRDALDRAGYVHIPVIVGCGAQSTRETIELCREAQSSGGDYAIILPPSYYKGMYTTESIKRFYTDVANASPIPILIYNYPSVTAGVDLDSDTIIELAKHSKIVGCKLTCGNTGKLNRIAAATKCQTHTDRGSGFMCMGGSADFTLQALVGRGSGVVAGLANLTPRICNKLIELYTTGKVDEAQTLQAAVARGDQAATKTGIVGTKSALQTFYGYGGYARRPLPRPTEQEVTNYSSAFEEIVGMEKLV